MNGISRRLKFITRNENLKTIRNLLEVLERKAIDGSPERAPHGEVSMADLAVGEALKRRRRNVEEVRIWGKTSVCVCGGLGGIGLYTFGLAVCWWWWFCFVELKSGNQLSTFWGFLFLF